MTRLPRLIGVAVKLVWRAARREFTIAAVLQLTAGVGVAAQLLVGKRLIDEVLAAEGTDGLGGVLPFLIALTLVTAFVSFATVARVEQQRVLTELVGRHAVNQVLEVVGHVDLLDYERSSFHDRLQRAQLNAFVRPAQIANGVLGLLSATFAIAGIATALLVLEPVFLALVILASVPAWFVAKRSSQVVYDFATRQTERDRRRIYLFQLLSAREHAAEVASFGLAGFLRSRHDRLFDEKITELRQVAGKRLRLGLVGGLATATLSAGVLGVLVWFVTSGRMAVAAAGAAAGAVILLGQRLRALSSSASSLYEGSLFLEDFTTFVEQAPALIAARPTATPPQGFTTLVVDNASFCYPSRTEPSLKQISMQMSAGEVVALVGENGSGKTTLAKLLAGLYTAQEGRITWDGVDLATCDPDKIRESVAVVLQDFGQYQLSAGENIGMGRHERAHDVEGIVEAARQAGAHEYLVTLAKGYKSLLGPQFFGGSDLSVGQWQRVALARAFFRDAPFLILDEPTAALDPRAEFELFESVRKLCVGRSVLLISHRFSSVRSADRIYVLREGRIVEHGNHAELMERGGLYAELFTLQASAYDAR